MLPLENNQKSVYLVINFIFILYQSQNIRELPSNLDVYVLNLFLKTFLGSEIPINR